MGGVREVCILVWQMGLGPLSMLEPADWAFLGLMSRPKVYFV